MIFRLYRERVTQIESKLAEVKAGRAPEYLQPLEELQINMKNRMEVSTVLRELRLANINCKFEAEQLATQQNFDVRTLNHFEILKFSLNVFHLFQFRAKKEFSTIASKTTWKKRYTSWKRTKPTSISQRAYGS